MSPTKVTRRVTRSSTTPPTTRILRSHKASSPTQHSSPSQEPKRNLRRRRAGADPWISRRKVVKNPNPRPRAPPPTHYTCRICATELPVSSFVKWFAPSRSFRGWAMTFDIPRPCIPHLSRNPRQKNDPVCKPCIGSSMAARMEMTGARTVSTGCLEPGCETYWDWNFVLKYMPLESLEAYNQGMFSVWRESVQTLTCTSESCSAVGLIDLVAPGYPQVECADCKTRMCASCNIPWHTGLSCADYAAQHINDKMTTPEKETLELMQSKDGKRCPNCYLVIEKDGGCDSMYCMGCRTYFNWAMAASAVPGAKKAASMQELYATIPVVCEMDGLSDKATSEAAAVAT